jgi:DNA-binding NarL/FixJ family response regulator
VMTGRILNEFAHTTPAHQPDHAALHSLTPRELDVLRELALGASNQEIAARLFIAENTVKNHVSRILSKLELPNRHAAARFARQYGLGDTPSRPT